MPIGSSIVTAGFGLWLSMGDQSRRGLADHLVDAWRAVRIGLLLSALNGTVSLAALLSDAASAAGRWRLLGGCLAFAAIGGAVWLTSK